MRHYILIASVVAAAASRAWGAALPDTLGSSETLGELVVTGSNRSTETRLLPYTVSTVGDDRLQSAASTQVLSAISGMVPSLFVSERGIFGFGVSNGGSGHIKLRGVGGDRASAVLMMVDGQPQFAGIYSHHIADFYGKEYVERVEVLRGPGSVLYGSNAMAGAINIITRNARRDGVKTRLTTQYGSYNTWLSSITNTVRAGRFSSLASLSYNRTDGSISGMDFKQAEGYIKAGYDLSAAWTLTADYTLMNFRGNDPVYPRLSDPESTDVYRQNVTRGETSLCASNNYGRTSGAVRAYYSYGNHYVDDPRHFHSTDDRAGVIIYQNITLWRGAAATVGFDFNTYSGRIPVSGGAEHKPGSLTTMERHRITEYSPYLTLSQGLAGDMLTLNAGMRVAASDLFSTQVVPQAGFAVNPGHDITLKGNVAMGYRNPSFRELYLYRMANSDLEPEKMMNYELSAGKRFSHLLACEVTAYYSRGHNMIQVLENRNENTGSFINKGIEVSAQSRPLDNLHLYASYSYLHTSLDNLTGAPMNQYYFGADLTLWKRLRVSADIKGVGGLFVSESMRRQNYAVVNTRINWTVTRFLDIFVRLDNITDARYTINYGYPMPGFTALGGLSISL